MHIRIATRADYESLRALDTVAPQEPERAEQIQGWIQQSHCYVADHAGTLLGL